MECNEPPVSNAEDTRPQENNRCFVAFCVEPILFLLFFSISLTDGVTINLLESKVCTMMFEKDDCKQPLAHEVEELVQAKLSHIIMYKLIIEALLPAIFSFFIGPWSDVNGRKPFLISSLLGFALSYLIWGLFSRSDMLPPALFLLSSAPIALLGGLVAVFTCGLSYVADITTEQNRAFRLTITECALVLGIELGYTSSSLIFNKVGYFGTFVSASFSCALAVFYTIFFLEESVINQDNSNGVSCCQHLKAVGNVLLKKRPCMGRGVIYCLALVCSIVIMIVQGEPLIRFLTVKEKFSWNLEDYNLFCAIGSLVAVLASIIGMWFFSIFLKIPDLCLGLIVTSLGMVASCLMAISRNSLDFYLSANLSCFGGLVGPLMRSELSRITGKSESGKVYGFVASLEAITPIIASVLYTQVYRSVLLIMPFAVYFLSAGLWGLNSGLLLFVLIIRHLKGRLYVIVPTENESLERRLII